MLWAAEAHGQPGAGLRTQRPRYRRVDPLERAVENLQALHRRGPRLDGKLAGAVPGHAHDHAIDPLRHEHRGIGERGIGGEVVALLEQSHAEPAAQRVGIVRPSLDGDGGSHGPTQGDAGDSGDHGDTTAPMTQVLEPASCTGRFTRQPPESFRAPLNTSWCPVRPSWFCRAQLC